MQQPFDKLIDDYMDRKLGVDTQFMSPELCAGLRENIGRLQVNDQLKEAGVGNATLHKTPQTMRGDKICWLERHHDNVYEQEFLSIMDRFVSYLNETCYTGINGFEFHYAVYAKGKSYKRHRDQFRTDADRKFSLVHYLNEEWTAEDGGQLWVYPESGVSKIEPKNQTAVFFRSDELEHEVRETHRERLSITGWLKSST